MVEIVNRYTQAVLYRAEDLTELRPALERAVASGAYLYGANLYGANLSSANLSSANLSSANLSGANLSGAYLYGANLDVRVLSQWIGSGHLLSYDWLAYVTEQGETWLRYGCVDLPLSTWRSELETMCAKHVVAMQERQRYVTAIGALLAYVEIVAGALQAKATCEVVTAAKGGAS